METRPENSESCTGAAIVSEGGIEELPQEATEQLEQLHEFADQYEDRGQYRQTAKLAYRIVKRIFNIVFSLCVMGMRPKNWRG